MQRVCRFFDHLVIMRSWRSAMHERCVDYTVMTVTVKISFCGQNGKLHQLDLFSGFVSITYLLCLHIIKIDILVLGIYLRDLSILQKHTVQLRLLEMTLGFTKSNFDLKKKKREKKSKDGQNYCNSSCGGCKWLCKLLEQSIHGC